MSLKIIEAFNFANNAHKFQEYEPGVPYITHLVMGVNTLGRFGIRDEHVVISTYLHDTLEDTTISYNDIKEKFGNDIAEYVYAVSNELGRNRKERWAKTAVKIFGKIVPTVIKLADRIANVEYSIATNNSKMATMYYKEYQGFKESLFTTTGFTAEETSIVLAMWKELDHLMDTISTIFIEKEKTLNSELTFSEAATIGIQGREFITGIYFNKEKTHCCTMGGALLQSGITEYASLNEAKEKLVALFPILGVEFNYIPLWHIICSMEVDLYHAKVEDPRLTVIEHIREMESNPKFQGLKKTNTTEEKMTETKIRPHKKCILCDKLVETKTGVLCNEHLKIRKNTYITPAKKRAKYERDFRKPN